MLPVLDGRGLVTVAPSDSAGATSTIEIPLAVGGFLVCTGSRRVLIDAGMGATSSGTFCGGGLLMSLRTWGVEPEQITDVAFTHLHWDHIGWAVSRSRATFRNATYWCSRLDWEYFVEARRTSAADRLKCIREHFSFVGDRITPDLRVIAASGHTPGSVLYELASATMTYLFVGDLLHCVNEVDAETFPGLGDTDAVEAREMRSAVLRAAADSEQQVVVLPAHLPGLVGLRISRHHDALRYQVAQWSEVTTSAAIASATLS